MFVFNNRKTDDRLTESFGREIELDRKKKRNHIYTGIAALAFLAMTIFWVTRPHDFVFSYLFVGNYAALVGLVIILAGRLTNLDKKIAAECRLQESLRRPGGEPPAVIRVDTQPGFIIPDDLDPASRDTALAAAAFLYRNRQHVDPIKPAQPE